MSVSSAAMYSKARNGEGEWRRGAMIGALPPRTDDGEFIITILNARVGRLSRDELSKAEEFDFNNGNVLVLQCHRRLLADEQAVEGDGGVGRDEVLTDGVLRDVTISVEHGAKHCPTPPRSYADRAETNRTLDVDVDVDRPREEFSSGARSGVTTGRIRSTAGSGGEAKAGCIGDVDTVSGVHQNTSRTEQETRGRVPCCRSDSLC